jgi:hypothetical protein
MGYKEVETYGIYPQFAVDPKERELRISKVKKMRKVQWKISSMLNNSELSYTEIKKLFDAILNEADSFLKNSKVTFKV